MSAPNFCPHCGFNITRDETIRRDGFEICPVKGATYRGAAVRLTSSCLTMLHSVAACDFPLEYTVIADRMGYDGDHFKNLLAVQRCRLAERLAEVGAPNPIVTVWGRGYQWRVAA